MMMSKMHIFDSSSSTKYNIFTIRNQIHFNGDISSESVSSLMMHLLQLETDIIEPYKDLKTLGPYVSYRLDHKPILLFITSDGGIVYQALRVCDIMKQIKVPIHTICVGMVASAATLISICGNERFIAPHSYMLIHQIRSGMWGKYAELNDEITNLTNIMNDIKRFYSTRTKLTEEQLTSMLIDEICWNAEKCVEYGLVDKIQTT